MSGGDRTTDAALAPRQLTDGPLPCFNGLRALAALSVVVFHVVFSTASFQGPGGRYLLNLNAGVWVFFAISGFLLYLPFVSSHVRGTSVNLRGYFVRCFARIYPGYWAALLIITLVLGQVQVVGVRNWILHLSLLQFYDPSQTFLGLSQAWTLTVEVSFYVFLPLYSAVVGRAGRRFGVRRTEVTGVLVLVAIGVLSHAFLPGIQWKRVLPNQLDAFGVGMLLAVAITVPLSQAIERLLDLAGRSAWPWWLAAGVLFLLIPQFSYAGSANQVASGLCRVGLGFFLIVPAVLGGRRRTPIRRVLASRVAVYLGLVSYGDLPVARGGDRHRGRGLARMGSRNRQRVDAPRARLLADRCCRRCKLVSRGTTLRPLGSSTDGPSPRATHRPAPVTASSGRAGFGRADGQLASPLGGSCAAQACASGRGGR